VPPAGLLKEWADKVSDKDILFKEGETAAGAYIILEGEVKLTRKNNAVKNILIPSVGPDEAI